MKRCWMVEHKRDEFCILVWAETQGKAKSIACVHGPWDRYEFLALKVGRVPLFDKHAGAVSDDYAMCNDDLPDGIEFWDEGQW